MESRDDSIAAAAVFADLDPDQRRLLDGCAQPAAFGAGDWLFQSGDHADAFYLLRAGRVALEIHAADRGGIVLETVEAGDVVGWSWLFEPYRWHLDARAVTDVEALAFDATRLRAACDADPVLGYTLMRAFSEVIVDRLQHARNRLLDVYGSHGTR